jgi:hypothetical protein
MCKFGGGATTTAVVWFYLVQSFWYFLLCVTLGESALSWLSIGFGVASWNHSFFQRLRCSGAALCLCLGDNGVALSMVKRAHEHYSNKYTSNTFAEYCAAEGIKKELTVPYNPQQNGVAERKNRTNVGATRAVIHD